MKPKPKNTEETNKTAIKRAFAKRLQGLLDEKGLNQSDLARAAAKHLPKGKTFGRYSINQYCNGKTLPRGEHLNAMAAALGVEPSDLLPTRGKLENSMVNAFRVEDAGNGQVWIFASQLVDWSTAAEIMKILKVRT